MRFFCVFYNISFLSSQDLQTVKELSTASESSNIYFEVTNTGKVRADEICGYQISVRFFLLKVAKCQGFWLKTV